MHIGLFYCHFLNDNDRLGILNGCLGYLVFRNGIVDFLPFWIKYDLYGFFVGLGFHLVQGGRMNEKGKNPNFRECTITTNVLDVKRSNIAIERSNVRVQARLSQRAEASNVRTCLMNLRTFDFSRS